MIKKIVSPDLEPCKLKIGQKPPATIALLEPGSWSAGLSMTTEFKMKVLYAIFRVFDH
jgi:hypothetical protein